MKNFILAITLLLSLTAPSNFSNAQEGSYKIQIIDQYTEDIKEAKKTEKVTVVMVTESWCSPCRSLKAKLSKINGIIVSKIGLKHPQVSKLNAYYKSKGLSPVSGIPDWVILKYKDGKLVHFSRYRGDCSSQTLNARLKKANTPNFQPKKVS